jgi:esterase/lipase superfamily enzyme
MGSALINNGMSQFGMVLGLCAVITWYSCSDTSALETMTGPVGRLVEAETTLPKELGEALKEKALEDQRIRALEKRTDSALIVEAEVKETIEGSKSFGPAEPPLMSGSAVEVYYITTRTRTGHSTPNDFYGSKRIIKPSPADYGIATVSIPPAPSHQIGKVERPLSVFSFELKEAVEKHIMVVDLKVLSKGSFFEHLKRATGKRNNEILIYIHGYYNSHSDALRRAAQIATDLGVGTTPLIFSWPSQDSFWGYFDDEEASRDAADYLVEFLRDIHSHVLPSNIHLIAHSMGSDVLSQALKEVGRKSAVDFTFGEVVFAAPDVDSGVFYSAIEIAKKVCRRVTTYVSSNDLAMMASHFFRKTSYRVGDSKPSPIIITGIDTIDASAINGDILGHSYIASNRIVLADFSSVLLGKPASLRFGLEQASNSQGGLYWVFRP